MRHLLFGGTFDPPHWGHMGLLENAIELVQPDRVVVIPAGHPPHKEGLVTPAKLRLAMCQCFYPLFPGLELWEYELDKQGNTYTVDTVKAYSRRFPSGELMLCMGGDMLLYFHKWYQYRELMELVTLVVQNRREDPVLLQKAAQSLEQQGGKIVFTSKQVPLISSTEIRGAIAGGEPLWQQLPPPADVIVEQERMYR